MKISRPKQILLGLVLLVTVIAAGVIMNGYIETDTGERVILFRFGEAVDILEPGLKLVNPIGVSTKSMDVTVQKFDMIHSAGTHDLQQVSTEVVVSWQIAPERVMWIYENYGTLDEIFLQVVMPQTKDSVKQVTAEYLAPELIQKRSNVRHDLETLLIERFLVYNLRVTGVSMTDFTFNPDYQDQIELAANAVQAAERAENELVTIKFEAQQQIIQAEAGKNATIIDAEAQKIQNILSYEADLQQAILEAEGIRAMAEAEAYAVELMQAQLAKSPIYVAWVHEIQWDGAYPTWIQGDGMNSLFEMNTSPPT